MIHRVFAFIKEHHMIQEGDKVVVGVSGGADSVCLLHILVQLSMELKFQVGVVHMNHNLRGQEGVRDQKFVKKLCQAYHLTYKIFSVDVGTLSKNEKIGIEEAGRKARYEAFESFKKEWKATKVALAHHQNDVAETMLYHLARGTKITGLCSIKPVRNYYIRPLLCMKREEIEHYLKEYHIEYVTDSSNLAKDYTRNKIRHDVVCYLEQEVNPKTVSHMASTSLYLQEVELYMENQARNLYKKVVKKSPKYLEIQEKLLGEPRVLALYVVRFCIEELRGSLKNITQIHLEEVLELLGKDVGKCLQLPGGILGKRTYTSIILKISPLEEKERLVSMIHKDQPLEVPGVVRLGELQVNTTLIGEKVLRIPEKIYTKWLDYDRIKGNLVLRTRKSGDYLVINKFGDKKNLKDFFINEKIPKEERDQVLLLACGSEILWIVGYRLNQAYKVTESTKKIMNIQVTGGKYCE